MKRFVDITISALVLLICSPLALIVIVWIWYDSGSPVFFIQQRVGMHENLFSMYKFRTMVANAERIGGYATSRNDNRITRSGYVLRKTSIDELPQLINVIRGDMSLVGPRPDVPAQQSGYNPEDWKRRCQVRPGITGLAQATLRSEANADERTQLDLEYVADQSLLLDIKILLMTLKQVLGKGGF